MFLVCFIVHLSLFLKSLIAKIKKDLIKIMKIFKNVDVITYNF